MQLSYFNHMHGDTVFMLGMNIIAAVALSFIYGEGIRLDRCFKCVNAAFSFSRPPYNAQSSW